MCISRYERRALLRNGWRSTKKWPQSYFTWVSIPLTPPTPWYPFEQLRMRTFTTSFECGVLRTWSASPCHCGCACPCVMPGGPKKKTSHWQAVIFSKNPMMWRFQEFQSMLCSQKLAPSMHQAVSWLTLPVFDLYFFCSRDCFLCLDSISLLCPWCQQVSRRRLRMPVGMSPQSNHPPFSDGKAFKKQLKDIWYGCCNRLLKVVFSLGRPRTPPVFPYLFHAFPKSSRQHAGNVSASRMTAQHELLMEIIQGEMPLDHGTSDTINEWYQRMES